MELILKKDIENLGFKDDIVTVKNGYGRNFLIPQGFAILATSSAKKVLAENLKQRAFKEAKIVEEAQKQLEAIKALTIKLSAKTGDGDKLFGSINAIDVAAFISDKNIQVEKKNITIPGGNIKRLGKYQVSVRLHREVSADVQIEIVAEK